jgi:chromosome segregation ATPase
MNELTAEYAKAADLDRKIKVSAQLAQQSLYDMCMGLKEMRDSKLYKELGYQNFEEYCENEVGLSRFMAYKYAAIADMKNVESIQQIGVTKLSLLAKLDGPQREEIQQATDLESTSVKELKARIAELKAIADKSQGTISQLESELESKKNSITALEEQVEELESRPVEVAVAETDSHEIENLKDAMKRVDLDWSLKYNELQESNLKESIEKNKAHTAEIEKLKAEYEEKLANTAKSGADCKEVFKVYLANAIDAVKRLISFANDYPEEKLFKEKIKELLIGIDKNTEE